MLENVCSQMLVDVKTVKTLKVTVSSVDTFENILFRNTSILNITSFSFWFLQYVYGLNLCYGKIIIESIYVVSALTWYRKEPQMARRGSQSLLYRFPGQFRRYIGTEMWFFRLMSVSRKQNGPLSPKWPGTRMGQEKMWNRLHGFVGREER